MENALLIQIADIKYQAIALLTYQKDRITINENNYILKLCNILDDILLDRVQSKRCSVEETIDNILIDYSMLFKVSKNSEVKRLGKKLEAGLNW